MSCGSFRAVVIESTSFALYVNCGTEQLDCSVHRGFARWQSLTVSQRLLACCGFSAPGPHAAMDECFGLVQLTRESKYVCFAVEFDG
jgi:hypothetical protein